MELILQESHKESGIAETEKLLDHGKRWDLKIMLTFLFFQAPPFRTGRRSAWLLRGGNKKVLESLGEPILFPAKKEEKINQVFPS
ncbi:hypothetical protein EP1X_07865 [Thermococcus sp. EP1]|nr:hypothetical protein EP1X_07865 [Thermococcus sp. EP1]